MTRYKRIQKICHESFLRKLLEDVCHQKQKITHQNVNKKEKDMCNFKYYISHIKKVKETGDINFNNICY